MDKDLILKGINIYSNNGIDFILGPDEGKTLIKYITELQEKISKAQDFIRNESYLNDAEIDELCEILEGDK